MNGNTEDPQPAAEAEGLPDDRESFVRFLREFAESPTESWANRDLHSFINAWAAWAEDMDGYFLNSGRPVPETLTWSTLASMLLAARVYE